MSQHPSFGSSLPGPSLLNEYLEDKGLQEAISIFLPQEILKELQPDLIRFGRKVATDYIEPCIEAERNPPRLQQYSATGERIDQLHLSEAWKYFKGESAREGLVAIPYENKYGQYSRIYQAIKLLLFSPSSALYSCPLAMADGAAAVLAERKDCKYSAVLLAKLLSRTEAWTSGQWMTEKNGGSDVARGTETIAEKQREGVYSLTGYKWFTSATDSEMALALAKIKEGDIVDQKPSLFIVETRERTGGLNGIKIVRLKEKLGTRQLPTAQLILQGCKATLISQRGRGIPAISQMVNITRLHNSISAVGCMRRIIHLARNYASKRNAFGQKLITHPLHAATIGELESTYRGCLLFVLEIARLQGLVQNNLHTKDEATLLRFLTPVLKLYTAKQCMKVVSEGLELFGGLGYLEDSQIPRILRDAQVLPIWEGTTNILSFDMLRVIAHDKRAHRVALNLIRKQVSQYDLTMGRDLSPAFHSIFQAASAGFNMWSVKLKLLSKNPKQISLNARTLAIEMAEMFILSLLVRKCMQGDDPTDLALFQDWGRRVRGHFQNPLSMIQNTALKELYLTLATQGISDQKKSEGSRTDFATGRKVKPKL